MMSDDTIRNIEYLREKANVSYEEASTLLERYDGNVMRVLVELERQGRVYSNPQHEQTTAGSQRTETEARGQKCEAKEKAASFMSRAMQHRFVVERGTGDKKRTLVDLNVPVTVGAAILAPYLAVGGVALMFVTGCRVRIRKDKGEDVRMPEDVEAFVDQTVSNIRTTASSVSETARQYKNDDDDDEGGEITIE